MKTSLVLAVVLFGALHPVRAETDPFSVTETKKTPALFLKQLQGNLVSVKDKSLKSFDAAALDGKKYIAVYYSAHWCPPCRQFTPKLVEKYNQLKSTYGDKFELVFVSSDESAEKMKEYMTETGMQWPAVTFAKAQEGNLKIRQYAGPGIPCLVILDAEGKVLSNSFQGEDYVGPYVPLEALEKLLKG